MTGARLLLQQCECGERGERFTRRLGDEWGAAGSLLERHVCDGGRRGATARARAGASVPENGACLHVIAVAARLHRLAAVAFPAPRASESACKVSHRCFT